MKAIVFPVLFVISCVIAGVYGFLHDQISYTVSPEYFTCFKFSQFGIPAELHNRWGAGLVGVAATWWMGLVIGLLLIPAGLLIPGWKNYLFVVLKAFGVAASTALLTGLAALAYGLAAFSAANLPNFHYPAGVTDQVRFAVIGNMHNFSYIGGLLGIVTALGFILREKRRLARSKQK